MSFKGSHNPATTAVISYGILISTETFVSYPSTVFVTKNKNNNKNEYKNKKKKRKRTDTPNACDICFCSLHQNIAAMYLKFCVFFMKNR